MRRTLVRAGSRLQFLKEQLNALVIPRKMGRGYLETYTFGCTVIVFSNHSSYKQRLDSLKGVMSEMKIEHSFKLDKLKAEHEKRKERMQDGYNR